MMVTDIMWLICYAEHKKIVSYLADDCQVMLMKRLMSEVQLFKGI